ncbi:hydrogenase 2 operon protein HybA [Thauera sp. WB-2]|uniref:hydrogenase 2 operon protein HybA n=1 Tax=Thauera sp. WB-2 TaxID=2897772 RepID=UPI0022DD47D0|nr:hydrogenase 2 operon protein HybA [Thauera sp. WB-2]WBL64648.1 hydrogenase 2 operon protein HybA [Thauera sp. WB-2]
MNARRDFFRRALAGGAAAAGAAAGTPALARGNAERSPDAVGLLFDATLCVGCKACVAACKEANDLPLDYNTPAHPLWDMPLDTTARTYNVIKAWREGSGTNKDQVVDGYAFVKSSCLHCIDPSCVSACPVSAMTKDPVTGIVKYDANACIGCRYCVAACPFGIPKYDYDSPTGVIAKCELCRHRMPEGKYAACAEVCPTGATLYGKVSSLKAEADRRLALQAGEATVWPRGNLDTADQPSWEGPAPQYIRHIYGEKEVGGTQMLKLSAVPFDKLGLRPLPERSFSSQSETLQHTLYGGLVLPLTVLGAMTWIARRNVKHDDTDDHSGPGTHAPQQEEGSRHD